MSTPTVPKTWSTGEKPLKASDLNANFAALVAAMKALDEDNFAPGAKLPTAILLADAGLTSAHLQLLSIAAGRISVGAGYRSGPHRTPMLPYTVGGTADEVTLATLTADVAGGPLRLSCDPQVLRWGAGQTDTLSIRWYVNTVKVFDQAFVLGGVAQPNPGLGALLFSQFVIPMWVMAPGPPAAGSAVVRLTGQWAGGAAGMFLTPSDASGTSDHRGSIMAEELL